MILLKLIVLWALICSSTSFIYRAPVNRVITTQQSSRLLQRRHVERETRLEQRNAPFTMADVGQKAPRNVIFAGSREQERSKSRFPIENANIEGEIMLAQRAAPVRMADIGKKGAGNVGSSGAREQERSKSRVLTIEKEKVVEDEALVEEQKEEAKDDWWRVILHNDEIHTFDYVTMSITKVVKSVTMKVAYEVTMETHKAGKATVTQSWKSQAETYCLGLQQCGLTASIAPDASFEGDKNKEGEGGEGGGGGPA